MKPVLAASLEEADPDHAGDRAHAEGPPHDGHGREQDRGAEQEPPCGELEGSGIGERLLHHDPVVAPEHRDADQHRDPSRAHADDPRSRRAASARRCVVHGCRILARRAPGATTFGSSTAALATNEGAARAGGARRAPATAWGAATTLDGGWLKTVESAFRHRGRAGAASGFHLMLQPMLGFWSAVGALFRATASIAADREAPGHRLAVARGGCRRTGRGRRAGAGRRRGRNPACRRRGRPSPPPASRRRGTGSATSPPGRAAASRPGRPPERPPRRWSSPPAPRSPGRAPRGRPGRAPCGCASRRGSDCR